MINLYCLERIDEFYRSHQLKKIKNSFKKIKKTIIRFFFYGLRLYATQMTI